MTATADTGELTDEPAVTGEPAAIPAQAPPPAPPMPVPPAGGTSGKRGLLSTARLALSHPLALRPSAGPSGGQSRSMTSGLTSGLTGPGGVLLAVLVLVPGVVLDLSPSGTFGTASTVCFVLAGVTAALAVRRRALVTAAVLPPLLFVGAVGALAQLSGNNEGSREVVLDVGTTLAVDAPVLFVGTAATLAVILGRLVVALVRR